MSPSSRSPLTLPAQYFETWEPVQKIRGEKLSKGVRARSHTRAAVCFPCRASPVHQHAGSTCSDAPFSITRPPSQGARRKGGPVFDGQPQCEICLNVRCSAAGWPHLSARLLARALTASSPSTPPPVFQPARRARAAHAKGARHAGHCRGQAARGGCSASRKMQSQRLFGIISSARLLCRFP